MENNNLVVFNQKRIIEIDYLKTLAMFLVVWGHFFECFSCSYSNTIYQLIYMFHMPLFIFITGYLSKFKYKDLLKFIFLYLLFYFIYTFFNYYIFGSYLSINLLYPYWLLWYLISIVLWRISVPLIDKIPQEFYKLFLFFLFLLGLLIGFATFINRFLSLSRTFVFYPFFVLGYFKKKTKIISFNLKINNLLKFILIVAVLIIFALLIEMELFSNNAFYMADPYYSIKHTIIQRFLIYIFSLIMIVLLSSFSIKKSNKVIECISKNTLTTFLLHGFIINLFKHFKILNNSIINIFTSFLLSIIVVVLLTGLGMFVNFIKAKIILKKNIFN